MLIDNIIAQADVEKQQNYRIFLCKMNREIIREITKQSYDKSYSPQLGGADKFSFSIAKSYDGVKVKNYEDIVGRNLVLVKKGTEDIGYFEIQNPEISNDGVSEVKSITALSAEIKLIHKKIFLTEGVFKLTNDADPSKGILNVITSLAPSWNIGYIDFELINQQRYFDIVDSNVYELLINQIQDTFECVIVFDTMAKTINAYALDNYGTETRIIISLRNLLQSARRSEVSENIVTRLHLYGDNEMTVRDINFGQTYIQNFGYFKNTRFMSQSLITALNNYETLVNNNKTTYSNYLASLQTLNATLVTQESDLLILQGELEGLEIQKAYLQSIGSSTTTIQTQINNKQAEITTKTNQINSTKSSINAVNSSIDVLLNTLSMSNNFTTAQLEELDEFIIEDTYQDSSFLTTDSMTYNEKIAVQQQLLDLGINMLARVSYPRYNITIDVVDFLRLPEYASWWDELKIGDIVRINVDDDFIVNVRVTGYVHGEDENKLSMTLGDRYQLDDANIELLELIKSSISAGTSVNYERYKYKDYVSNSKNEILGFINSSIDVAKNSIISGTNVGINIDQTGILATALDPNTGLLSPKQLRISNNAIVISDDGFVTAKTAIGRLANGSYGIAAEVLAGKMILGNNMIIETGSGDFRVDGNGVSITKMALSLTSTDNLKKILIDPNVGFKIQSRPNTAQSFADKFFVDSTGRLKFEGDLVAGGGVFGGTVQAGSIIGGTINGTTITGGAINGAIITAGTLATVSMFNDSNYGVIRFTSSGVNTFLSTNAGTFTINSLGQIGIFASGNIELASTSGNIRFQNLPLAGSSYLATQDWVSGQSFLSFSTANFYFVKKGSGVTVDTLGNNPSKTYMYVRFTDGVEKRIPLEDI